MEDIILKICSSIQLDIDGDIALIVHPITGRSVKAYIHGLNGEIKILEDK